MPRAVEARLADLGITLPPVSAPVANYLGCKRAGDMLYVGGHGPVKASGIVRGKVGATVTLEQAREAAKATALSMLATVRAEIGDATARVPRRFAFGWRQSAAGAGEAHATSAAVAAVPTAPAM